MAVFAHPDRFVSRHIGPRSAERDTMLQALGVPTMEALIESTVPAAIRERLPEGILPPADTERGVLNHLADIAGRNRVWKSYLGMGYHDTRTPPVIQRCILENPGWYTQYTPYQPEISQGRLEALATFQTLVTDLTGLEIANASLLDEATAAAEAVHLALAVHKGKRRRVLISDDCHPQVIRVVQTRCEALGVAVDCAAYDTLAPSDAHAALIIANPATDGALRDVSQVCAAAKVAGALAVVCTDLLACCLATPPGEQGADIALGSAQRFGVPLGGGGPHAAFFACAEAHKRLLPGRLVGLSQDSRGAPAYRLALQTREQHIRREKATSNICTAQALLANISAAYAVYHGPEGLRAIAAHVHACATALAAAADELGLGLRHSSFFDTLAVQVGMRMRW